MKTAFISTIFGYPWGGADALWTRAAEAAQERGDQILVAVAGTTAAAPRIQALRARGAALFVRPAPAPASLVFRVMRKLHLSPSAEARLVAAVRDFQPDLVVVSQGGTYDLLHCPSLIELLQSRRIPYRIIANWQEERPRMGPREICRIRAVFAQSDRQFFVSSRNLAVTRRHLMAALPDALVIHNPLRYTALDLSSWPAGDPVRFATVSRLDPSKGVDLLLDALAECRSDLPDFRLTIHGVGDDEPILRQRVLHLGLESRVQFAGHVSSLASIWGTHQVLCSPAVDDGVPMTIPEAMLCQRPVLATCVGGAEDWLEDGRTGFLCPAPTVPLLAATLRRACLVRSSWPAMGERAAAAATARYRPGDFQSIIAP